MPPLDPHPLTTCPAERRRVPARGHRVRVAVVSRRGSAALVPADVLRLAKVADVRFLTPDEASRCEDDVVVHPARGDGRIDVDGVLAAVLRAA
ncbi:MAG TPA: hypothetical protein VF228_00440 [Iamia sp.]